MPPKPWLSRTEAKTRLFRRRVEAGLTQRDLAERSGVPLRTVQRIDRGELQRRPSLEHLSNLAVALGCEAIELIEDEWLEWAVLPGGPARPPSAPVRPRGTMLVGHRADVARLEAVERAWLRSGRPLPYHWREYLALIRQRVRDLDLR